jgi:hypothetical protein
VSKVLKTLFTYYCQEFLHPPSKTNVTVMNEIYFAMKIDVHTFDRAEKHM